MLPKEQQVANAIIKSYLFENQYFDTFSAFRQELVDAKVLTKIGSKQQLLAELMVQNKESDWIELMIRVLQEQSQRSKIATLEQEINQLKHELHNSDVSESSEELDI